MSQDQNLKKYIIELFIILKAFWKIIKQSIKKYWYISLGICGIFAILTVKKYQSIDSFYTSKTSFNYNYLHKKFYGEQIVDLQILVSHNKTKEIASLLNIDQSAVENLISIKALNIYGKLLHEDLTDVKLPFYLEIEFKDEQYLTNYQEGLLYFFNSSPFTAERIDKIQDEQKKKLRLINKELALIDTMLFSKTSTFEGLNTGADLEKILTILETKESEKVYLNSVLGKNKAVDLLKPFFAIPISKSSQFTKWVLTYLIICFGLSVIIPMSLFWMKNQDVD